MKFDIQDWHADSGRVALFLFILHGCGPSGHAVVYRGFHNSSIVLFCKQTFVCTNLDDVFDRLEEITGETVVLQPRY